MANKMGVDLEEGDIIVLQQDSGNDFNRQAVWEVVGGFGMRANSRGHALYIRNEDGDTLDARGYKFRRATEGEVAGFTEGKRLAPVRKLIRVEGQIKALNDVATNLRIEVQNAGLNDEYNQQRS